MTFMAAKSAQVSREEVLTVIGKRPWTCEAQLCVYECVFPPGQRLHTLLKLPLKLPVPAFKEIPGLVLLITLKIYFIFRKQTQCSLKELASHSSEVWICFYSCKINLLLLIIINVSITYSALQTIKAKVDNVSINPYDDFALIRDSTNSTNVLNKK